MTREDWQGEPQEEPDFGPPGPADTGGFQQSIPPPPPREDYVEDAAPPAWNAPDQQWVAPAQTPRPGTGALVVGVLALILSLFCALLGIPLAVAAIVMGVKGRKQAQMNGLPAGMATAGLVLGIVALALGFLWMFAFLALGSAPSAAG